MGAPIADALRRALKGRRGPWLRDAPGSQSSTRVPERPGTTGARMNRRVLRSLPVALGLCCLAPTDADALDPKKALTEYSLTAWQAEDGLPQDTVQALAQTRDGYLWAGTVEGLARFDGVGFTVFGRANEEAFASGDVQALFESRDGSLWIGTYGGGLIRYRDGGFRAYGAKDGLSGLSVRAIAEDPEGQLWIGTDGDGLFRFRGESFTRHTVREGLASDSVEALFVDHTGNLWIGTASGLNRLSQGRLSVEAAHALAGETITAVIEDAEKRLWIGTHNGLYGLRAGRAAHFTRASGLCHDSVRALRLDSQGRLWIGTDAGLNRLSDGRLNCLSARDGLSDEKITAILEDREGSLWLGTLAGGLTQLKEGPIASVTTLQGLPSDNVESLSPARQGGFWIGTNQGQVGRLADGAFLPLPATAALRGAIVRALHEDRAGRVWIGTEAGLFCFAAGRWTRYTVGQGLPHNIVRSILEDRSGRLWIGTEGGGLARLEGGRFTTFTTRDGLPSNQIRALLEDRTGMLWISTYGGLAVLEGGGFRSYTVEQGLASNLVRSLYEDADAALWIGTYGGGLSRLEGGRITSFTSRDGLYNDVIYAILDDGRGRLWMTCNRGLFSVDKRELAAFAARKLRRISSVAFGKSDGMRSADFNGGSPAGARAADGRLWFPTLKGLVVVDPSDATRRWSAPSPLIQEVAVEGVRQPARGQVELQPDRRRLTIRYASLGFLAPERILFSYRLEGFDPEWVDAGAQRTAHYSGLPPGDYRFRVRARTETGIWSSGEASFEVRQRAYWYRTRAFFLLTSAALLLLAGTAYRVRVRGLVAREQELSRRVEQALAEVRVLGGLIPICANCKKIRDDRGFWNQLEAYIRDHSEATFTHGICPDCINTLYPEVADRVKAKARDS